MRVIRVPEIHEIAGLFVSILKLIGSRSVAPGCAASRLETPPHFLLANCVPASSGSESTHTPTKGSTSILSPSIDDRLEDVLR